MVEQTQKSLDSRVFYHESPAYAVATVFRDMGYEIAKRPGLPRNEPDRSVIEILKPRDPVEERFLGIRRNKSQRPLKVGTLWFDNQLRYARPDEMWVLEVYGRDNIPELTDVVEKLSEPYQVRVKVELASNLPRDNFE